MRFKFGVSDWKFYGDDGTRIVLKELEKETVTCYSNGRYFIELESVTCNKKEWDFIFDFKKIKKIKQSYLLYNQDGDIVGKQCISFFNPSIMSHGSRSLKRDGSNFIVKLACDDVVFDDD